MAITNAGRKVYICATPQTSDLDLAGFAGLTWVEIGHVGAVGESGTKTNIVNYDELGTTVIQKAKGLADAGNPTIEVARNATDAGQDALRAAALLQSAHAFKFLDTDSSVYYNRGIVTGPTRPNGRVEDFVLEVFTIGCIQDNIANP